MGKRIGSDDGFIRSDDRAGDFAQQAAGFIQFLQIEFRGDAKTILAHGECDRDLLKRGVPGAFTDAVNRAFDLADARANRGQRIGDRKAEVVMAMRAQGDVPGIAEVLADLQKHRAVLFRHGVSDGVRQIQHGGAVFNGNLASLAEKLNLGSAGVFGGKFDLFDIITRQLNHGADGFERLLARQTQLSLQVQIRRGEKHVHARRLRGFQRFRSGQNVVPARAGKRGDGNVADFFRNGLHGLKVASGSDRKTGFNNVHAEGRQLAGHPDLFLGVHGKTGRLFTVAEGSIENSYVAHGYSQSCTTQ